MIRTLAAWLVVLASIAPARADDAQALARGREMSALFIQRKLQLVWPRMTPAMQAALGSQARFEAFREQVAAQLGDEIGVVDEKVLKAGGADVYLRSAHWAKVPDRIVWMQWAFDEAGQVAGFFVRPAPEAPASTPAPAPTNFLDYQTKASLRLPFRGEWRVVWGGRTPEQNYHVVNRSQRFAYDLLIVRGGSTHRGDGKALEQYHCWKEPILAPAKGTVVSVVDGLADQEPGKQDVANPAGNHVILDLGEGEYALLAHLKQASVQVGMGDRVEAGQQVGRCGNSGNTTEPHLHFHLQNASRFGEGDGLPAFFNDYLADGKPVRRGEPVRGERIQSP